MGCFHFSLATMDKAAVSICVYISGWMCFHSSWVCVSLEVAFLGHMEHLCITYCRAIRLPTVVATLSLWLLPHSGPVSAGEWRANVWLAPQLHVYMGPASHYSMNVQKGQKNDKQKNEVQASVVNASASLHSFYTHRTCANLASTSPLIRKRRFLGTSLSEAFCFPN